MSMTLINPGNQQGLRYLFDIADPQSNPEKIDMSAIQPVIDMGFDGYARMHDYGRLLSAQVDAASIAGVQTKTWDILCYGNKSTVDVQIEVPIGNHFVVWGTKLHIYFNSAGAAAFNGKYISGQLSMICPDGSKVCKWHATGHVSSSCLLYGPGHYEFSELTRENLYIVPAGCKLQVSWWVQDGSNFPANTTVEYRITGQYIPCGAPIPANI